MYFLGDGPAEVVEGFSDIWRVIVSLVAVLRPSLES